MTTSGATSEGTPKVLRWLQRIFENHTDVMWDSIMFVSRASLFDLGLYTFPNELHATNCWTTAVVEPMLLVRGVGQLLYTQQLDTHKYQ